MALTVSVRMGGGTAATTVDYTAEIPLWELNDQGAHQSIFDAGMKCDNGNATQYQFTIDNDLGDIPRANLTKNLPAFTRVTVTEDGPGFDCVLSYGRIARKDVGRGDKPFGDARQFRVTANDANFDLTDLDLVAPWVRGAESGRARVLALITAFLSGDPRPTTDFSTDTDLIAAGGEVTMPAKTYPAGTSLIEILNDCATIEGKTYSVVTHHVSNASHPCFLYIDEEDHTTYASTISISDVPGEINNTTVFAPIWDQGPASLEDGDSDPITHLVSTYGSGTASYVVAANSSRVTSYDYRSRHYNDSKSETASQALTRANAVLGSKGQEHVSHQVTIKLKSDQVDLVCAGMSIDIKSAAAMGGVYLDTVQTRRIAELKWEPLAPEEGAVVGYYNAHMQLERAVRLLPEGPGGPVGPQPPSDPSAASATGTGQVWEADTNKELAFNVGTSTNSAIYLIALHHPSYTPVYKWYPEGILTPASAQTMTVLDSITHVSAMEMTLYRLLNPTVGAGDIMGETTASGEAFAVWFLTDVNTANPQAAIAKDTGTGTASALTISNPANSVVIDAAGWGNNDINPSTDPTPGAGQVEDVAGWVNASSGNHDIQFGGSHGDATPTWTWDGSRNWCAIAVSVNGSLGSGTPQPPGEADPGDSDAGEFANADHVHPPGIESASAPTVNDDSGDGYDVGNIWVDTTTDTAYVLVDDTVGAAVWVEIGDVSALELDDLSDVTITTPAEHDRVAYNGSAWVNDAGFWEPVTDGDVETTELVFEDGDVVMEWVT